MSIPTTESTYAKASATVSERERETWPTLDIPRLHLPAVPMHVFPEWLQEYAQEVSGQSYVPAWVVALYALVAFGAAAAKRVGVRCGQERHPTALWLLGMMHTGEGKSPMLEALLGPFQTAQRERKTAAKDASYNRRVEHRLLRRERDPLERRLLALRQIPHEQITPDQETELGEAMRRLRQIEQAIEAAQERPEPCLLVEDVTAAALVQALAANEGVVTLASDEGSVFFRSVSGPSVETQVIENVLKAYSYQDITVHRVSRPSLYVPKPALSVILATQPPVIRSLLRGDSFGGRGLWERFMLVFPPSSVGNRRPVGAPDPYILGQYGSAITTLLDLPVSDSPVREIHLSPEARAAFDAFCVGVDQRMSVGDLSEEPLRGWAGKLRTNALRLAAVHHLCSLSGVPSEWRESPENEVRVASMLAAVTTLNALTHHARYALVDFPREKSDEEALIDTLRRLAFPEMTLHELHRRMQSRFPRADLLREALIGLEDRGVVRLREQRHEAGRPSVVVRVHPELLGLSGNGEEA